MPLCHNDATVLVGRCHQLRYAIMMQQFWWDDATIPLCHNDAIVLVGRCHQLRYAIMMQQFWWDDATMPLCHNDATVVVGRCHHAAMPSCCNSCGGTMPPCCHLIVWTPPTGHDGTISELLHYVVGIMLYCEHYAICIKNIWLEMS